MHHCICMDLENLLDAEESRMMKKQKWENEDEAAEVARVKQNAHGR
ncbi:hypothetical protein Tco_1281517, partial [Tanacetum coccineum]